MAEKQPVKKESTEVEVTGSRPHFTPLADIYETEAALVITVEMPGVKKEHVDISIEGERLEILGHAGELSEPGQSLVREFELGDFHRAFSLPGDVDTDRIAAKMADGVLVLSIGKREAAKVRKIEVKTG